MSRCGCSCEAPSSRSRLATLTFVGRLDIPHRQNPVTARSVKTVWLVSPERLRPARFSILRPSEADCGPCYVRAIRLAPFRPVRSAGTRLSPGPDWVRPPSRGRRRTVLPTQSSVRLSALLGLGGKMLLTDLCNRSTTRAPDCPFDFPGTAACAAADHGVLRRFYPTSPSRRRTTFRQSSPGSYALDGAQTSFESARSRRSQDAFPAEAEIHLLG
jgi:hypothetical protein